MMQSCKSLSVYGRNRAVFLAALGLLFVSASSTSAQVTLPVQTGGAYQVSVTSWRDLPFRTVVRQKYDYSCGSAALATLLHHHYGRNVGEAEIFKAMYTGGDPRLIQHDGFSLLDMKRYLASLGLEANGFRVTLDQIAEGGKPGIALVSIGKYRHFVVIKGVKDGKVLIGDPALGLLTFDRRQFEKMWNGLVFVIYGDNAPAGAFNRNAEWMLRPKPVADFYLGEQSPSNLMRDLPTLYQISPVDLTVGG